MTLIVSLHCAYKLINSTSVRSRHLYLKLPYFLAHIRESLRPLPVTPGQLSDNTINFLFIFIIILNRTIFPKRFQYRDRKRYGRVAQPMRRHVGRGDASAGNMTMGITAALIPDELLKPVG
ncbi:uncharacterized protein BcabD6B2_08950 [Babesia caballi]|uniref:Uncharacterized protein n=1 Tax=Babesia caballi TaxID=5871 RepID=A0AAV4LNT5_BABCB|nr:hypothetical protein, conserved [Babesia caballi]